MLIDAIIRGGFGQKGSKQIGTALRTSRNKLESPAMLSWAVLGNPQLQLTEGAVQRGQAHMTEPSSSSSQAATTGAEQPPQPPRAAVPAAFDSFFRPSSLSASADKLATNTAAPAVAAGPATSLPAAASFRLCPPSLPTPTGHASGGGIGACNGGSSGAASSGGESSATVAASSDNPFSRFVRPISGSGGGGGVASRPFVFGENLAGRVHLRASADAAGDAAPATFADAAAVAATPNASAADGAVPVIEDAGDGPDTFATGDDDEEKAAALMASAQKYQREKLAVGAGRELSQVAVVTGEEDEENVLHMPCRVFVFDAAAKSWVERGHAFLRLNDRRPIAGERGVGGLGGGGFGGRRSQPLKSRLICRSQGGLKVIVNTLLWPDMLVESIGGKRIRVSVQSEDGGLRVCLLALNSPGDAQQLSSALLSRLRELRAFAAAAGAAAAASPAGTERRGSGGLKRRASDLPPPAPAMAASSSSSRDTDSSGSTGGEGSTPPSPSNDATAAAAIGDDGDAPVERKRPRPDRSAPVAAEETAAD